MMSSKKVKEPAKAEFTPRARDALKIHLNQALINTIVSRGFVFPSSDQLDKFLSTSAKYFSKWLSDEDIVEMVTMNAYGGLRNKTLVEGRVPLSQILSSSEIEAVSDNVLLELSRIPRRYDILFPLPNMQTYENEIILSPNVSLVSASPPGPVAGTGLLGRQFGLAANGIPQRDDSQCMYLRLSVVGYSSSSRTQSAMRDATALLKRTIQIGVIKKAFVTRSKFWVNMFKPSSSGGPVLLSALIYDHSADSAACSQATLGLGMSTYLNNLCIDSFGLGCAGKGDDSLSHPEFEQRFIARLRPAVTLLTSIDLDENARSLASAFEWAFEAAADDEVVPRCIKTCIALEAALSEDADEGGITERLADRFAYLIGRSPADRKHLRAEMRAFYQLRSKLVHGKKSALSSEDQSTERSGSILLEMVLRTELAALEKWQLREKNKAQQE